MDHLSWKSYRCTRPRQLPDKFYSVVIHTSGLDHNEDDIICVASSLFENGEHKSSGQSFFNCYGPISSGAFDIHNINKFMISEKPCFDALLASYDSSYGFDNDHTINNIFSSYPVVGANFFFSVNFLAKYMKLSFKIYDVIEIAKGVLDILKVDYNILQMGYGLPCEIEPQSCDNMDTAFIEKSVNIGKIFVNLQSESDQLLLNRAESIFVYYDNLKSRKIYNYQESDKSFVSSLLRQFPRWSEKQIKAAYDIAIKYHYLDNMRVTNE